MDRFELVVLSDADVDEVLSICSAYDTTPAPLFLVTEDSHLTPDQLRQVRADRTAETPVFAHSPLKLLPSEQRDS